MISQNFHVPPRHQDTKLHKVLYINLLILVNSLCLCALVAGNGFSK
jgi:hypothetical protein